MPLPSPTDDITRGLNQRPASISPKYFYDQRGSALVGVRGEQFDLVAGLDFTLPDRLDAITFQAFARLPLEWALMMLLLLAVPRRLRRLIGLLCGLVLLLILFLKTADIGTQAAFQRPFNPYLDVKMLADGWNLMSGTLGTLAAFAGVAAALATSAGAALRAVGVTTTATEGSTGAAA